MLAGTVKSTRTVSPLPACAGIGLKPQHFDAVRQQESSAPIWYEVHPENYLMTGGPMHHYLQQVRENFPLSFHSVGMSLGSGDGVPEAHVRRLKTLIDRYQPALVSDHLSWSRWAQFALNDLLPMPYTEEALRVMVRNVDRVQSLLGRPIAIENPSSYLLPDVADMQEWEFLVELAWRSGATLLLDVNNVYVSACNHGWSAEDYIRNIPPQLVSEMHLAGHKVERLADREILIDDHGSAIADPVWELYALTLQQVGAVPTLIEWDTDVPEYTVLTEEARRINACLQAVPADISVQAARRHA